MDGVKKYRVKKYLPDYVETYGDTITEVSSKEELLNIEWVKTWTEEPTFVRFVLSKGARGDQYAVMALYDDGADKPSKFRYKWYVVVLTDCIFENGERLDDSEFRKVLEKWFDKPEEDFDKFYRENCAE